MWTKEQIKERTKQIRSVKVHEDYSLANLFEMQNRLCDLCGRAIQDLSVVELDHSIPVSWFAKQNIPIETAKELASHPSNLKAAHYSCNSAKNDMTRKEWFSRGLNDRDTPRMLSPYEIEQRRARIIAAARKGGLIGGPRNVERRSGFHALSVEEHRRVCSLGGSVGIKNGHLEKMRNLPQTKQAQRSVGLKAIASGQFLFFLDREHQRKAGRAGARKGALASQHLRWHVRRNIVNPKCSLCQSQQAA